LNNRIIFPPCRSWQVGEEFNPALDSIIILPTYEELTKYYSHAMLKTA